MHPWRHLLTQEIPLRVFILILHAVPPTYQQLIVTVSWQALCCPISHVCLGICTMITASTSCAGVSIRTIQGPSSLTVRRQQAWGVDAKLSAVAQRPQRQQVARSRCVAVRAERDSGGGFFAGVLVGGAIFGALGYLFAPQISKALLSDDQRLKLPRFLEEEKKSPEATKQDLAEKIEQLNAAIDEVSSRIGQDGTSVDEQTTVTA